MPAAEPGSTALDACTARYVANLAALYGLDSDLAARIDALPFAAVPPLEPTRDGEWTVRLIADDGKPIYAHSRYQPRAEARTHIEQLMQRKAAAPAGDATSPEQGLPASAPASATRPGGPEGAAADDPPDDDLENLCFLVSGLGLGYHLAEIEQRFTRPLFLVAEDDLALIKCAFCACDLTRPLADRRVVFLTDADRGALHERLRPLLSVIMLGIQFVVPPHTRRYRAAFHAHITRLLNDFATFGRMQMVSVVRNARITFQNAVFNIPAYLAAPGVEVLERRAAGYPAIVVAAGPSLARNIDQLAGLRDRAVIIAVQTVLKTLLARGIQPHFVTSLDYHEISGQFFHELPPCPDTLLVAESKVTWHVPDAFPGRKHMLYSNLIEETLREVTPHRGTLRAGSTVAHLSFYLAEHLGCDPVLLVGQDLSFTEGLYYPPGMQIERIWRPELSRFQTIEMKQWERIVRSRAILRKVKDIHGRDVYADEQMFTYAEQFQSDFLASRTRIIHASEGGMRLDGTTVMPLRAAAAQYCTRPLPSDLFALPPAAPDPELKDRACAALDQRIAEVRQFRASSVEMCAHLAELAATLDAPARFNRIMVRVDELRAIIRRSEQTYDMVTHVSQHAELRRVLADRAIHDDDAETVATARRRLKRDREYVAACIEGCDYLLQILPQARARIQERLP